jgi:hypothetical protein
MNENIETKECSTCHEIKNLTEFHKIYPPHKPGYGKHCLQCFNKRAKERRLPRIDRIREYYRTQKLENPSLFMFYRVKQRAKMENISFNIVLEDIVIPESCPVFGYKFVFNNKTSLYNSPSLDRVNNLIGYEKDNIKVISYRANLIKNKGTYEDHEKIIKYIKFAKYIDICSNNHNFKKETFRGLLYGARNRAKKYNVPIDIYYEDIIIPKVCPVLGITLKCASAHNVSDDSPTLDRIIPSLGYTKGNIMVISHKANTIKHCGSIEDHEKICKYIKENI